MSLHVRSTWQLPNKACTPCNTNASRYPFWSLPNHAACATPDCLHHFNPAIKVLKYSWSSTLGLGHVRWWAKTTTTKPQCWKQLLNMSNVKKARSPRSHIALPCAKVSRDNCPLHWHLHLSDQTNRFYPILRRPRSDITPYYHHLILPATCLANS
jgi:hypothetical protein